MHVQEYVTITHVVRWTGPLFIANAAACAVLVIGLAFRPTRQLAALGGVVTAGLTLAGLVATVVGIVALTFALTVAAAGPVRRAGAPAR